MANIELYTFGEVVKVLGIGSNEMNRLIEEGKLRPVRHQGKLKFKKSDIDDFREKSRALESYSWDQVLRELQIEDAELEMMVSEGEVQVYKSHGKTSFHKKEIDRIKHLKQIDATIVVEQPRKLSIPEDIPSMEVPIEELSETNYLIESNVLSNEDYYSFDQVLALLQIESRELEHMLSEGEICAFHDRGELKFKKVEVDCIKNGRMIDATIIVESKKKVEEEEEIQPILISASSDALIPVVEEVVEEYYNFTEATYELQVTAEVLKRMVAKGEVEATKDRDGQLKFRKADIDRRAKDIEPTVILPDEPAGPSEETVNLPDDRQAKKGPEKVLGNALTNLEKSFYTIQEASKISGLTEDHVRRLIEGGKVKTYRFGGEHKIKRGDIPLLAEHASKTETKKKVDDSELLLPIQIEPEEVPVSKPAEKMSAPEPSFYSLEEVMQLLGVDEKELKMMVARGDLAVQRVGKNYQFSRASVQRTIDKKKATPSDKQTSHGKGSEQKPLPPKKPEPVHLIAPKIIQEEPEEELCTLQEAMESLGVGKPDIQRFVKEKHLTLLPGPRFYKNEVEKLKSDKNVEVTMVIPLFNDKEEDDEMGFVSAPRPYARPSLSKGKASEVAPKKTVEKAPPAPPSPPEPHPKSYEFPTHEYYTFEQASIELQMEKEELEELVRQGSLKAVAYKGQRYIKKVELETMKTGKMIEPTIMVENDSDDILEEDDDDFFFSK